MLRSYFCFLNILIVPAIFFSCSHKGTPQGSDSASGDKKGVASVPSAPCIIYKTRADYSGNVPVMLSPDKSRIVSYPDKKDIYYKGKLAYPTALKDGYLLDNRGIGPDAAFLKLTYEAYRDLDKTPSSDELLKLILDNDPVTEMYQCGYRSQYTDPEKELNEIITSGKLGNCKRLK